MGELSALNGIAGAYAEHLPIFHLIGAPNNSVQQSRAVMHHTLGNGEYDLFRRMSEPVACAHVVMTPQNVAYETERLIFEALYHRRPVYMAFPADFADQPVLGTADDIPGAEKSDPAMLEAATSAIVTAPSPRRRTACVLPGILVARSGLQTPMGGLIEASGLPFATMFMDKSVLDERQPGFVGMYDGAIMDEAVGAFVEGRDQVLTVGTLMSDFNSGAFTARLDPARTMVIAHHHAVVGGKSYPNVEMGEIIAELTRALPKRAWPSIAATSLGAATGSGDDPIDVHAPLSALGGVPSAQRHPDRRGDRHRVDGAGLRAHARRRQLLATTRPSGDRSAGRPRRPSVPLPAAPSRRVVLITGDGSHQLTAQEIGQPGRMGLKPIVFVRENDGYLIERRFLVRIRRSNTTTSRPGVTSSCRMPWAATAGSPRA